MQIFPEMIAKLAAEGIMIGQIRSMGNKSGGEMQNLGQNIQIIDHW